MEWECLKDGIAFELYMAIIRHYYQRYEIKRFEEIYNIFDPKSKGYVTYKDFKAVGQSRN
jgi:Ca2+-binding EF-hand superfamily protein